LAGVREVLGGLGASVVMAGPVARVVFAGARVVLKGARVVLAVLEVVLTGAGAGVVLSGSAAGVV